MVKKIFNPELYLDLVVHRFKQCPGILALGWHGSKEEHTDIDCKDYDDVKHVFYVPLHGVSVTRCGSNNRDYIFTKVCSVFGGVPDYWLVTDYLRRNGYLFPIDTFDKNGEELVPRQEPETV